MLFFGAVALVVARLVGTTQLYQFGYALVLLLPGAFVLGFLLSRGFSYERRLPDGERLVAGGESALELVVRNGARQRSRPLEITDRLPDERFFTMSPVAARSTETLRAPVRFRRRGIYTLGPAEVYDRDPFGLLSFAHRFEGRDEVVVYPRTFELHDLPQLGRGPESGSGGALRRGDEFSGLREYRHGDDRRHIHWKSVARTGELVVKEFAEDAPRRYAVVLDLHRQGARAPEAEVEDAVSAAGTVLRRLAGSGLPFRLLINDRERQSTGFGPGEASFWRAMRMLATARADGDADLEGFLDGLRRGGRSSAGEGLGEGVVFVSRSLGVGSGDGIVGSVDRLRAAGLPVVVVAIAAHTYVPGAEFGGAYARREAGFLRDVERLEVAGAAVRILGREGGVAAFAEGDGAANTTTTGAR